MPEKRILTPLGKGNFDFFVENLEYAQLSFCVVIRDPDISIPILTIDTER